MGSENGGSISRVNVSETGRIFHNQSFEAFLEKDSINYIKFPEASKYFACLKSCRWYSQVKIHCIYLQNIREHISNLLWMAYVSHCSENDKVITFGGIESNEVWLFHLFLLMHGDREK